MGRPKSVKSAPARPPVAQAATAFMKLKPRLAQLRPEEVAAVSVEIPAAVSIALGAVVNLRPMRAAIAEELPKHPVAMLDELEDYALAVFYAHLLSENQDGGESVKKLAEEGAPLREALLIGAEALAHRGLLDAQKVAEIRSGRGRQDLANDLAALGALFTSQWERVKTKTAVEEQEVRRAEELGTKMLLALAAKDTNGSGKGVDPADTLARAWTLLSTGYSACRRAAAYLRWEQGDVDDLAPPLTRKTPGRKPGSTSKAKGGGEAAASDEVEIEVEEKDEKDAGAGAGAIEAQA
jgi:hypothetical protein